MLPLCFAIALLNPEIESHIKFERIEEGNNESLMKIQFRRIKLSVIFRTVRFSNRSLH